MSPKYFEIEQKYRIARPEAFRRVLNRLGARQIRKGREHNILYDRGGHLSGKKSILRLRHYGRREGTLTFKGPKLKGPYKKRVEIETPVDARQAEALLVQLGYEVVAVYRKHREEYQLGRSHVTLDHLPKVGWFLEIEGSGTAIGRIEKQLGLTRADREESTYLELVAALQRKSGIRAARRRTSPGFIEPAWRTIGKGGKKL